MTNRLSLPGLALAVMVPIADAGAQVTLTERVSASADTAMHYALLRPATDSGRRPALIVMDPRGRALRALNIFRAATDSLGWIVVSSYETASDDPNAPNVRAVNAIVRDLEQRWQADMSRLYIAGFSGTARLAWDFASQLQAHVAGVIAAGAGLTGFPELLQLLAGVDTSVAYATGAGLADFNWIEVRETELLMRARGRPQRAWYYPGGHAWPPASVGTEMVLWLAAEARHRRPGDSAWMRARAERQLADADSLRGAGRAMDALTIYEAVARQLAGSAPGTRAAASRKQLENSKAVRDYRKTETTALREARDGMSAAGATLATTRAIGGRTSAKDLRSRLGIDDLLKDSRGRDSVKAAFARRRLEHLIVQLIAIEPRDYLAVGDTARARLMLDVAASIDSARARSAASNLGVPR